MQSNTERSPSNFKVNAQDKKSYLLLALFMNNVLEVLRRRNTHKPELKNRVLNY